MRRPNLDAKPVEDLPCAICGRVRADPTHDSIDWTPIGRGTHLFQLTADDCARLTEPQLNHLIRLEEKRQRGLLDPPLPPPAERRRIRQAAGWTQNDVADTICVSRHLVFRWEKPVGYDGTRRLPGREPCGKERREYAALLQVLSQPNPPPPDP